MHYRKVSLLAMATVATLALASCSAGSESTELDPDADVTEQSLVVSVWADYYPEDLAETFEAATGIPITIVNHATNEEVMGKLTAGGDSGIDVAFVSGQYAQALNEGGLLQPLDESLIPNEENLYAEAQELAYDPGNTFSMPYAWGTTGLCYRSDLVPTAPTSWNDLLKPEYKGKFVMPHPGSSGTAFNAIAGWIKAMGEANAWTYMDKLHENVAVYLHSGSAPCVQAARGERMIGLGFDMRGASEKSKGAPIQLVVPKEGSGWDMEAVAIIKGTKNLAAAQKLADFAASRAAHDIYGKYYAIVGAPGQHALPANYPPEAEPSMLPLDLPWMAANRDRILTEWSKRYDAKSAPK